MNIYKVLIVEDEAIVAEDIKECLEEVGFEVFAIAPNGRTAIQELQRNTPDIVLLDINLDGRMNGIEVAHHINRFHRLPFVFLTSYVDKVTLEQVKQTFPMGYLVKPFNSNDLLSALEIALLNFNRFRQEQQPNLFSKQHLDNKIFTPLTDREFDVLKLLLKGKTNKEMGTELYVSVNTIKTHLSNIYVKLEVDSRAKVLAFVSRILQKAS